MEGEQIIQKNIFNTPLEFHRHIKGTIESLYFLML
jgi:hypothetical protein